MPLLRQILGHASNHKAHQMLRAKALECISLVGMAIGRDRFREDAHAVLQYMQGLQVRSLTWNYLLPKGLNADVFVVTAYTRCCAGCLMLWSRCTCALHVPGALSPETCKQCLTLSCHAYLLLSVLMQGARLYSWLLSSAYWHSRCISVQWHCCTGSGAGCR